MATIMFQPCQRWPLLLFVVILALLPASSHSLAVYLLGGCGPHPTLDIEVCNEELYYYYIPEYYEDAEKGYFWVFNYFNDTQALVEDNNDYIGEKVLVRLGLDEETCEIGLGGDYGSTQNDISCNSCAFCGFAGFGGDGEVMHAQFTADCTNIPGGRKIDTCESTDPFFYPVDWYDPAYCEARQDNAYGCPTPLIVNTTEMPEETMNPSDMYTNNPSQDGSYETMDPSMIGTYYPTDDEDDHWCPGDLIYHSCDTTDSPALSTCPPTCSNAIPLPFEGCQIPDCCIYPGVCTEGCFCPPDRPVVVDDDPDDIRCVATRDQCPTPAPIEVGAPTQAPTMEVTFAGTACDGDLVFVTCGGTCPRNTCDTQYPPDAPCQDECISACVCPPDKPLAAGYIDGRNVCVADVSECPVDDVTESPQAENGAVSPRMTDQHNYDLQSQLIITLSYVEPISAVESLSTIDIDVVLEKLKEFLDESLMDVANASSSNHNRMVDGSVDLVFSDFDISSRGNNKPVVTIDFATHAVVYTRQQTQVSSANKNNELSERDVAVLLTQAKYNYFVEKYLQNSVGGVFQKATHVVFKAIGH